MSDSRGSDASPILPVPASPGVSASVPTTERLELLDALRGFALLGVLVVNLRDLTLYSFIPQDAKATLPTAQWDRVLDWLMALLVDGKAFTLFTLLFGVGFAMQMQRETPNRLRIYVRRLLVLFVIGLVHAYALWWGDILRLYALLGLLLIPLRGLRPATLAAIGVFVAVFASPLLRPLMLHALPAIASATDMSRRALEGFASNDPGEVLRTNFQYDCWTRINAWGLPLYILGRIIIGAAIGRANALRDPVAHPQLWRGLIMVVLPVGVALTGYVLLHENGWFGTQTHATDWTRTQLRIARSGGSLCMGLGYTGLFVLLLQRAAWRNWLSRLAPVGQMALTNYLAQTAIAIAVFYGIGFDLGPYHGLVGVVIATLLIFTLQVFWSRWWLARFRFGPAEWLWRSLSYGYFPDCRRAASPHRW